MSEAVQRAAETTLAKRYEALLRVSQTLISIRSSEELFKLLANELRVKATVIQTVGRKGHDGMAIAIVIAQ